MYILTRMVYGRWKEIGIINLDVFIVDGKIYAPYIKNQEIFIILQNLGS